MKKISVLLLSLILLLSLFGCGASTKEATYYNGDTADFAGEEAADFDYGYKSTANTTSDTVTPGEGNESENVNVTDRKLVKNASLSIQTKEFDNFVAGIETKVNELNGYIESQNISSGGYYYSDSERYATITVRIPADKLDRFMGFVSDTATVTSKSVDVSDITSNYIDTESHIKALETEQSALLEILSKAKTVSETLEVQQRLSEVRASLESYKSTLKSYDKMVAYSTVKMTVDEVERVSVTEKEGFFAEIKRKLVNNLGDIKDGLREFVIWFISSLPYIAIFAVCVIIVIKIFKKIIRKRKKKHNTES